MKKPLVIVAGPTATGKSHLAVKLAKRINGSIISADSMQVYKYMDIGSAKIKKDEMCNIPHYLVDCLLPSEEFNVSVFCKMAGQALEEIYAEGRIPIVCGGTGFYIDALLRNVDFEKENTGAGYRAMLEELAKEKPEKLHEMLRDSDPESAERIHENNLKRIIRALEYIHDTGRKFSLYNDEQKAKESPYDYAYFVLIDDRKTMYDKIDRRVDLMLEEGLIEEVTRLKEMGYKREDVAMQGLGYKEVLDYLNGDLSLEEAIYLIKRDTRHFAKRQVTWFKRNDNIIWLDRREHDQDLDKMADFAINVLKENKLIEE